MHCKCILAMVFQWPGLCLALSLLFLMRSIFPVFPLSAGLAPCLGCLRQLSWLCCSGDGWGPSCCCSLSNGSSSPGLLAASLPQPGLCPHPLQPDLHSLRPARSKSTEPELQRENEAPAQELPGCVQDLAQGWLLTGQVKLRHRQAAPTRFHYKQKHPDRNFSDSSNSCTWGVPEGSTSTRYGSGLSCLTQMNSKCTN